MNLFTIKKKKRLFTWHLFLITITKSLTIIWWSFFRYVYQLSQNHFKKKKKSCSIKAICCFLHRNQNKFLKSGTSLMLLEAAEEWASLKQVFRKQVFLSLNHHLIAQWFRLYMSFYNLNRRDKLLGLLKQFVILNTHWRILCSSACKLQNFGTTIWETVRMKFNNNCSGLSILPSLWSHSNVTAGIKKHQHQENTTWTV